MANLRHDKNVICKKSFASIWQNRTSAMGVFHRTVTKTWTKQRPINRRQKQQPADLEQRDTSETQPERKNSLEIPRGQSFASFRWKKIYSLVEADLQIWEQSN